MNGGEAGETFAACFTTRVLRRISVPGGGPSKKMTTLAEETFMKKLPCNCTHSLSVACTLNDQTHS